MPMNRADAPYLGDCPLPAALDVMGERWSFLILRAALTGVRHFEDFQGTLGIARNILASRLAKLVDNGILSREVMACDKRKVQYLLTGKGRELAPVMVALRQWGERWGGGPRVCMSVLVDREMRQPLRRIAMLSQDGRELELEDLLWLETEQV